MSENTLFTAIDVGTTKICTVVGRKTESTQTEVLTYNTTPCNGLRNGNVWNMEAVETCVRKSLKKAEKATGSTIDSAFVGITGSHVGFENRKDRLDQVGKLGVITVEDIKDTQRPPKNPYSLPGREIIHAIRTSYSLDGQPGIRNPLGMHSAQVEAETHLVTGDSSFINKLIEAIENSGVGVTNLVLEPLASSLAVLTPEEKELDVMVVDLGGGTSDLVGFRKGTICYSAVIPVGGYQFTNDIALTFNASYEESEKIKLTHASADIHPTDPNQDVFLTVTGQDMALKLKKLDICQLSRERALELAQLIKLKIDESHLTNGKIERVVLTGGASKLPGIGSLMQRTIGIPVRLGSPNVAKWVPTDLKDPSFATAVGILMWATTEQMDTVPATHSKNRKALRGGSMGLAAFVLGKLSKLIVVPQLSNAKNEGEFNGS